MGDRQDPWGTPVSISKMVEEKFWKFINPFLLLRKLCNMFKKSLGIFRLCNFFYQVGMIYFIEGFFKVDEYSVHVSFFIFCSLIVLDKLEEVVSSVSICSEARLLWVYDIVLVQPRG